VTSGPRLLTDSIRARVGESRTYTAPDPLGLAAIRYFAQAIGDRNPLYLDAAFARAHGHPDVVAPPTMICETNQYMTGGRDSDGSIGHSWGIEVPGTRVVRGGNSYEFHAFAGPDTVLSVTWRVADAVERMTASGAAILVLTSKASYHDQDGVLLATNTETLIYQEMLAATGPA